MNEAAAIRKTPRLERFTQSFRDEASRLRESTSEIVSMMDEALGTRPPSLEEDYPEPVTGLDHLEYQLQRIKQSNSILADQVERLREIF